MLHWLSAAVLVLLSEEPPPPHPASAAAQSATAQPTPITSIRVKAAPVYCPLIARRSIILIAAVGVMAALVAPSGNASPAARAASFSSCDISGKQQHLGTSYVTSLKVQGVSCAKAEKVIKAYHQ